MCSVTCSFTQRARSSLSGRPGAGPQCSGKVPQPRTSAALSTFPVFSFPASITLPATPLVPLSVQGVAPRGAWKRLDLCVRTVPPRECRLYVELRLSRLGPEEADQGAGGILPAHAGGAQQPRGLPDRRHQCADREAVAQWLARTTRDRTRPARLTGPAQMCPRRPCAHRVNRLRSGSDAKAGGTR